LVEETPALFLAFDLLKKGKTEIAAAPLTKCRPQLEDFAARFFPGGSLFRLSPASLALKDAQRWLASAGGGSDGVIAKRLDLPYQAGNRDGMQKIKRYRSADCVIGGVFDTERTSERAARSLDPCYSDFTMPRASSITWGFLQGSRPRTSRPLRTS
jgi:ATP-dependent DNA ligase